VERSDLSWVPAEVDQRFGGVVAEALDTSEQAARHLIDSVPAWGMSREPGWWQLLVLRGEVAGFVLPVIYDNCARDGLDEATIFHMGVLPAHRASGLGRLLLRQATRVLVDHGVWRIYCDTAADNSPMIHLFESEGWRQAR
jgi:ribosomal protein S18 acetylase RimI-like enzyme